MRAYFHRTAIFAVFNSRLSTLDFRHPLGWQRPPIAPFRFPGGRGISLPHCPIAGDRVGGRAGAYSPSVVAWA